MKPWVPAFSDLRIKNKMLLAFLPLIIGAIVLIGVLSHAIFQKNEINRTINSQMNNSVMLQQRIVNMLDNAESCIDMLTFELNDLAGLIKQADFSRVSEIERRHLIQNQLDFALLVFSDVDGAVFVDAEGRAYATDDALIAAANMRRIGEYIDPLRYASGYSIRYGLTEWATGNENSEIVMPLGKRIVEISTGETLGYLFLLVNEKDIAALFEKIKSYQTSDFYLVDDKGTIISSTVRDLVMDTVEDPVMREWIKAGKTEGNVAMAGGTKVVYTTLPLEQEKWMIVYRVHLSELMEEYRQLRNSLIVVTILCVLIAAVMVVNMSTMIVRPLHRLMQSMQRFDQDNEMLDVAGKDEIGQLTRTFNRMTARIRELIGQIREEQRAKRKYELALIQQQIKPHFLYNTLDMIGTLADLGRIREMKKSTRALADFYRKSLSGGLEIIPVREEIQMIRSYLYIQHIRYKDHFDYDIRVTTDALECKIPKLTLQPLVENAIYHGLKSKSGFGRLEIRGYVEDGELLIEVKDDGIGMNGETIRNLWNPPTEGDKGFGLYSIDHRIKLYFGESYGLRIDSAPGRGTAVIVKIPAEPMGGPHDLDVDR